MPESYVDESELQMMLKAAQSTVETAKEEFGSDHEIVADALDSYAELLSKTSDRRLEAVTARQQSQEIRRLNNPNRVSSHQASSQRFEETTANNSYAGFWLRFVARVVDSFLIGTVLGGIGFVGGLILGIVMAALGEEAGAILSIVFFIGAALMGLIVEWLYFAGFECSSLQATPGKLLLGLKVTTMDGKRIGFGRATGRFFGKLISAIPLYVGFMMAGWTEKKQALHDMMCETLVVRKQ